MPSIFEQAIYAIITFTPYTFFALYPFEDSFRYSRKTTYLFSIIFFVEITFIFVFGYNLGGAYFPLSNYIIATIILSFYFIVIKSKFRRMTFVFFMIKNTANVVVVTAKYLESILFPGSAETMYCWTNSLCMVIVLLLISPMLVHIVKNYFSKKVRDTISPQLWKILWPIPLFFYCIWLYILYFASPETPLEVLSKPGTSLFMLFFIVGQFISYIYLGKMVLHFHQVALLKDENNRLAAQSLQYREIQARIREITVMKHDMRHHVLTLCNYADNGDYEELTKYLHKYINAIPSSKVSYCSNVPLNMLLVYYSQRCKELEISFDVNVELPENMRLSDSDVTVIFGNLLENAMQACKDIVCGERKISFSGKLFQKQLVFVLSNPYEKELKFSSAGTLMSTKHSGQGIGTASVKNIVKKHNGTVKISTENNEFSVSIVIPFNESET